MPSIIEIKKEISILFILIVKALRYLIKKKLIAYKIKPINKINKIKSSKIYMLISVVILEPQGSPKDPQVSNTIRWLISKVTKKVNKKIRGLDEKLVFFINKVKIIK